MNAVVDTDVLSYMFKGDTRAGFYQAQLTIPGKVNVTGASLYGVPPCTKRMTCGSRVMAAKASRSSARHGRMVSRSVSRITVS